MMSESLMLIQGELSEWMRELPEEKWDTPLNEIAIPGTHNSFSYALDPSSEMGPDVSDAIKAFGQLGKSVVYKWSVTCQQNFQEQLQTGNRYFEFRIASRKHSEHIHFIHGLYGSMVEKGLKEINSFLDEHNREIVIIDFNHFYNMTDAQHEQTINLVAEVFGSKLCMFVGCENLTLRMMWENNFQVVVIYQHKVAEDCIQVWSGNPRCIFAPYANTPSVPKLLQYLEATYQQPREGRFHVIQGVLTADAGFIMGHLSGCLKNDIAKKAMPALIEWLSSKRAGKQNINICIADYTDMHDFTRKVIELNYK